MSNENDTTLRIHKSTSRNDTGTRSGAGVSNSNKGSNIRNMKAKLVFKKNL